MVVGATTAGRCFVTWAAKVAASMRASAAARIVRGGKQPGCQRARVPAWVEVCFRDGSGGQSRWRRRRMFRCARRPQAAGRSFGMGEAIGIKLTLESTSGGSWQVFSTGPDRALFERREFRVSPRQGNQRFHWVFGRGKGRGGASSGGSLRSINRGRRSADLNQWRSFRPRGRVSCQRSGSRERASRGRTWR